MKRVVLSQHNEAVVLCAIANVAHCAFSSPEAKQLAFLYADTLKTILR